MTRASCIHGLRQDRQQQAAQALSLTCPTLACTIVFLGLDVMVQLVFLGLDVMDGAMDVASGGDNNDPPPPVPWSYSNSITGDAVLDELERATDEDLKLTPHEQHVRWVADQISGELDMPAPDFEMLSRGLARETIRMISWKDGSSSEERERRGLTLDFGEYYISDPDEELSSSDDEMEEAEEVSEAVEVSEGNLTSDMLEEEEARGNEVSRHVSMFIHNDGPCDKTPPSPSLIGMPDEILQRIFLILSGDEYENFQSLSPVEAVCKRMLRVVITEKLLVKRNICRRKKLLRSIRKHQKRTENIIIKELASHAGDEGVAGVLRDVAAGVVSRMHHSGDEIYFRLRGDVSIFDYACLQPLHTDTHNRNIQSLGYLTEFLQDYMVRMLDESYFCSIHGGSLVLKAEDIILRSNLCPQSKLLKEFMSSEPLIGEPKSGATWRWPEGGLCGALPPDAGRTIVRGLAFRAGVCEMNDDAFLLAEEVMLRLMGVVVVDALEATIETSLTHFLKENEEYVYDSMVGDDDFAIDAYCIPPPPIHADDEETLLYTVVPGLLRNAVRSRFTGHSLYSHPWVKCQGDAEEYNVSSSVIRNAEVAEEEWELEASYYYEILDCEETWTSGESDDDSSMEDSQESGDRLAEGERGDE